MTEKTESRSAMSQFLGFAALVRLLRKGSIERPYRAYAAGRLIFSLLTEPLRCYEKLRWGRALAQTELKAPPVFLLGMGRSGTTHLHYLLWQDPQFGVVTNYQANMHPIALSGQGWLDKFLASRVPDKRPMDNVAITLSAPQEEELALANITEHAAFHFASFPKLLPDNYDRYVTQLGQYPQEFAAWKKAYWEVLKKATLLSAGKRLLLKTPTHTGRVAVLTEMFPGAKYVYIVRNPYRVYQSMRNMYRQILPGQTFQDIDWDTIDRWILDAYKSLISSYLQQRSLIPADDLVEIRFEDLDQRPMEQLEGIYRQLQLGDFETVRPAMQAYLDSLGVFEKNQFQFSDEVIEAVNEHWGFAFDAFGYEQLSSGKSLADEEIR